MGGPARLLPEEEVVEVVEEVMVVEGMGCAEEREWAVVSEARMCCLCSLLRGGAEVRMEKVEVGVLVVAEPDPSGKEHPGNGSPCKGTPCN